MGWMHGRKSRYDKAMDAPFTCMDFDPATRRLKLSPRAPDFVADPYAAYAFLHEHSPVFFWEDYGFWCLASYEAVDRTLRDRRFGRERPGGYMAAMKDGGRAHLAAFDRVEASSLLELEPPVHTRLRKLVSRAFVSRRIEQLRARLEALCHRLVDDMESESRFDLIGAYATPLPVTIIAGMLGVPEEDAPRLLDWSHRMVAMYMHAPSHADEDAADAAARDFSRYIRDEARRKRHRAGDDLLSLLAAAASAGDMTQDELVSSAILLLNAGHEATVHQIGNAVATILAEGGDPRRHLAAPETRLATVEECLRVDPPLHMFTRYAYEHVELAPGIWFAPGEQVGLLLAAANHDPAAFDEPRRFLPGRPGRKNVSFGAGIHFCLGAPLARLELEVGLTVLFERLPGLRLAAAPVIRDSYHFRGFERLDCAMS